MKWKKIAGTLLTILLGGALLIQSAFVLVPRLMGLRCFAVTTGSMEPALPVGTLVLTDSVPMDSIRQGDVLTFSSVDGQSFFTHRVTAVDGEAKLLYTKGDANDYGDPAPTSYDYVAGRVCRWVPYLGYVKILFSSYYTYAVMAAAMLLYLAVLAIQTVKKKGRAARSKRSE